ncbi:MAG: hypothetical protein QXW00_03635 [Candidatus Woesearchaeota archaeon]
MRYYCGSAILGRKEKKEHDDNAVLETAPIFINLCTKNNPHLTAEIPFKFLEFKVHKVIIRGLDVYYLIPGTDIVINNLEYLDVEQDGPHLYISGKQKKTPVNEREPLPAYLLKILKKTHETIGIGRIGRALSKNKMEKEEEKEQNKKA